MPTRSTTIDGVRISELGSGLVCFQVDTDSPTPKSTLKLHERVHGYILTHRGMKVVAALPWVSQGETIGVHLWTEGGPDV